MIAATSSRDRELSDSAVARCVSTMARASLPSPSIVALKLIDMARIGMNTATAPAMPMTITSELPSRRGMFRRFMAVTASVWLMKLMRSVPA